MLALTVFRLWLKVKTLVQLSFDSPDFARNIQADVVNSTSKEIVKWGLHEFAKEIRNSNPAEKRIFAFACLC